MQHNHMKLVWDPLVRIFHWTVAACFFLAYFTEDTLLAIHVYAGYTILGLVTLRVLWGFVGTRHARFADFVHPPRVVLAYIRDVVLLRAGHYTGHNPAGGAMVLALLGSLLATAISGVMLYGSQEFLGPLANLAPILSDAAVGIIETCHEFCANFTLGLSGLHLGGVALASLQHRENLVRSMITGLKATAQSTTKQGVSS